MNIDLFNVITNSLRNYSIQETETRINVPLTNMHRLHITLDPKLQFIATIDLVRIADEFSTEKGIYCKDCHNDYFSEKEIQIMWDIINHNMNNTQSWISKQFNDLLLVMV